MTDESGPEVPHYDRRSTDRDQPFTRIGDGALGGKAEGLRLIRDRVLPAIVQDELPGFQVLVPRSTVLTTELFDEFLEGNGLQGVALSGARGDRLVQAFLGGEMPERYLDDLRSLTERFDGPLAVRSSSLLEDDLKHPFAGIYSTKMIPNDQDDADDRLEALVGAVKLVYASTFFKAARDYAARAGSPAGSEKMAVVVQEVLGRRRNARFYPSVSGVARSHNYYPPSWAEPGDGVVVLAMGLGKTIVDGGRSWTYCPADPRRPQPFRGLRHLVRSCQTRFWAVRMGSPPIADATRETEYLTRCGFEEAEADDALRHVASTYSPQSDVLTPGTGERGPRVLNFAPLLTLDEVPLNGVLQRLLSRSQEALGCPVEMEFAADLDPQRGLPARVAHLQVRPMAVSSEKVELGEADLRGEDVLLSSHSVLGNGSPGGIRDVVFVKPGAFDPVFTQLVAREVERFDRSLRESDRPYVLIGLGRWGSADSWAGIPVGWSQICGARVIVEASLPQVSPELSQGSNLMQNLTAFSVLYVAVRPEEDGAIDWDWLSRQETVAEGDWVIHVRTAAPLKISVDGHSGRGVVKRGEG